MHALSIMRHLQSFAGTFHEWCLLLSAQENPSGGANASGRPGLKLAASAPNFLLACADEMNLLTSPSQQLLTVKIMHRKVQTSWASAHMRS